MPPGNRDVYSPSRPLVLSPQSPVPPSGHGAGVPTLDQAARYPPNAAAAVAARQYDLAQHVFSQHTAAMAKLLGKSSWAARVEGWLLVLLKANQETIQTLVSLILKDLV